MRRKYSYSWYSCFGPKDGWPGLVWPGSFTTKIFHHSFSTFLLDRPEKLATHLAGKKGKKVTAVATSMFLVQKCEGKREKISFLVEKKVLKTTQVCDSQPWPGHETFFLFLFWSKFFHPFPEIFHQNLGDFRVSTRGKNKVEEWFLWFMDRWNRWAAGPKNPWWWNPLEIGGVFFCFVLHKLDRHRLLLLFSIFFGGPSLVWDDDGVNKGSGCRFRVPVLSLEQRNETCHFSSGQKLEWKRIFFRGVDDGHLGCPRLKSPECLTVNQAGILNQFTLGLTWADSGPVSVNGFHHSLWRKMDHLARVRG